MHGKVQEMYHQLQYRSSAEALGHMNGSQSVIVRSVTSILLMSNFADHKNLQLTNHILSRPTLSISSDKDHSESPGKSIDNWRQK